MDYKGAANTLIEEVGGRGNVDQLTHCATRLRFTLKDSEKADQQKIKAIPGILGVVNSGGQFQVIVGQDVVRIYNEVVPLLNENTSDHKETKKVVSDVPEKRSP